MKSLALFLVVALLLGAVTGCLAGNARSERTRWHFYRDRYRAAYLNQQWANQMARQRADEAKYWDWRFNRPDSAPWKSQRGRIEQNAQEGRKRYFGSGPFISIPRVGGQLVH